MEDRWGHDGYKELEKKEGGSSGSKSRDRSKSPRERSRRRSRSRSPHSKHSRRSSSRSPKRDKKRSRRHSRSPYSDEGKSDDERRGESKRRRGDKDSERRRSRSRDRDSHRERDSHRDRSRDRERSSRDRDRSRDRDSHRDRDRDSRRDRDRDGDRSRDRDSHRESRSVDDSKSKSSSSAPERSDYKYGAPSEQPPPPPRPAPPPTFSNGYSNGHTNGGPSYSGAEVEGRYGLSTEQEEALLKPSSLPKIDFDKYDEIPVETSGRDCPSAISTFADVDLGKVLMENIKSVGYDRPTPVQKNSIPIVLSGRDLMACAQTGSGKTAAFLFPVIAKLMHSPSPPNDRFSRKAFPLALVLAPTRELACQIQDECKKFSFRTGLKSAVVYGGSPIGYQLRTLEQGCDILVATPGRLVDIMDRDKVSLAQIKFLVLDEADRMLDMGFEPQIRKIVEQRDMTRRGLRRTLMFSATFPKEIQQLASQFLEDYIFLAVGRVGSTTDLVTQNFVKCDEYEKSTALLKLVRETQGLTLIFVETKRQAESLGNLLISKGFPATSIHGDRAQKDRTAAIRTFSTGRTPFLVATNVAARGLDIENIAHVINYDMPGDIDDYVHRIGRTGRAGKAGISTSLITPGNSNIIPKLIELLEEAGQELPRWLDEMKFDRSFKKPRHFGRGPKFGGTDFRRDGGFNARPPPSFGGGDSRGFPSGGAFGQYPPRPQGYGGAPPPPSGPAPPGPARPYAAPTSSYGPPAPGGYSSSGYSQPGYQQGSGAPSSYGPTPPASHRGAYAYKPY